MPFAINEKVKVYYEVEGEGPPLILAHGVTGNTTYWRGYGYVDQLIEQFTVIAFDARGHGKSDKPHEAAAYDQRLMVADVLAIMDALDIEKAHFWGYSMGGNLGFSLAKHAAERLVSLIAGGTDPYYSPPENMEPNAFLSIFERGVLAGPEVIVDGMRSLFGTLSPQYEERLRRLDAQAMVACMQNAQTRPSHRETIPLIDVPCLLYVGDADDACYQSSEQAAREMRNGRFFSLPGLNHVGASSAVELIMPHVLSFLSSLP